MSKKNILVTGGCGFIGANFVNKLANYDCNIIVVDNLSSGFLDNLSFVKKKNIKKKLNFFFYKIDLKKKENLHTIFRRFKIDYIFHFAAFSNVEGSLKNPKKFKNNNVKSTLNLLYFVKRYRIKNFIFSSTAAVYGNVNFKVNIKEDFPCKPINPYGSSKLTCEKKIISLAKKIKFRYCIFRYFNVVGKHVSKKVKKIKYLNLFETILKCVKKNKLFYIYGNNFNTFDGTAIRDYIHMDDVITAHIECLKKDKEDKFWNKIFNIGYNKGISVLEVLTTYNRFFTNKVKYKFTKEKKGIIIRSVADNRKFLKLSNWKPKYSNLLKIIKSYYK